MHPPLPTLPTLAWTMTTQAATPRKYTAGVMAVPIVDRRERALSAALGEYPHVMKDLPIGDVLCSYEDGTQWIAERKETLF